MFHGHRERREDSKTHPSYSNFKCHLPVYILEWVNSLQMLANAPKHTMVKHRQNHSAWPQHLT
jgi:hypothetical protein